MLEPTADAWTLERFSYAHPSDPPLRRAAIRALESAGGRRRLWNLYQREVATVWREGESIFDLGIKALKITLAYDAAALAAVPREGPILFIANHPYGVLDGVAFAALAQRARPDVKILAHSLLCIAEPARPNLLPVDFGNSQEAVRTTTQSRIDAQRILRAGGAVGIFPAGAIATAPTPLKRRYRAYDPPWHRFTAKLIQNSKATVVPMCFSGQNSRLFHLASHVSHAWRLAMIFRETRKMMGSTIKVGIGAPIAYDELAHLSDRNALVAELRRRTLSLGGVEPEPTFTFPRHMRG